MRWCYGIEFKENTWVKMLIDAKDQFILKKAFNGCKESMCEMIDKKTDDEDIITACEILERFVENEPNECERLFVEITSEELTYEQMLILIAWNYYHDRDNDEMAFKWFQKYFDYVDFKYAKLSLDEKEEIKRETNMYEYMKNNDLLDRNENSFWLKWEREHFLASAK